MQLFHPGLKDLLLLPEYSSRRKFGFVSIEVPIANAFKNFTQSLPSYSLGLNLRREYRHIAMGIQALKLKNIDTIFVFEAYNQHFFFLLPLLALTGKDIFIMLHGNQQLAMQSKIKYIGLLYLKNYLKIFPRFKVLLLEVDDKIIPEKYRLPAESTVVVTHPLIREAKPRLKKGERLTSEAIVKIGVVGIIRADKPIAKLIEKLQQYIQSSPIKYELIVGTPLSQKPQYLDNISCTVCDTTKEEDYLKVLNNIDILVTDYEKESYYYRTSGVISDAGSSGCYIIAPDYPVIRNQVKYPAEIGATFQSFADLDRLLNEATVNVRERGQDNNWLWREKRGAEYIAKILDREE
jgi:hypothetical protein